MTLRIDRVGGSIASLQRTPGGGIRIPSRITRTGVFTYLNEDGSERREFRPPEEVFRADALASFADAPVTVGHPGAVTPANFREHSVGHVGHDVKQDGTFVAATLIVQDAATIAKIEKGELVEISCGYDVDLEKRSGMTQDGEAYDYLQRNMRGNHVAIGPRNWGRAGPDVRMMNVDRADVSATGVALTPEQVAWVEREIERRDGDLARAFKRNAARQANACDCRGTSGGAYKAPDGRIVIRR